MPWIIAIILVISGSLASALSTAGAAEDGRAFIEGGASSLSLPPAFGASDMLPALSLPANGKTPDRSPKEVDAGSAGASAARENSRTGVAFIDIARPKEHRELDILQTGPKEHKADVYLGFRLLPNTEVLLGKGVRVERTPTDTFVPYDDGWRFKFKTHF